MSSSHNSTPSDSSLSSSLSVEHALTSNAWPFVQARALLKRIGNKTPAKGYVLFETGYGPSGLPHIGTFGEVMRTTMVRRAFELLAPTIPTRLYCISDDMDGLRKVPDTIPTPENYTAFCPSKEDPRIGGVSLTKMPDPFGTHESYGAHMNARLCRFLDQFGFEYEFKSASECYRSGEYDEALLEVARKHEEICNLIKPTLGEERRATFSPIMPIVENRTLQVPVEIIDAEKGLIQFNNPLNNDETTQMLVTGGNCKLGWKADWGMRWAAFGVDYEMYGKDLVPSAKLSARIAKIIGHIPPEGFDYELFLDEKGQKISKSKGNGLTMEDWLRYGSPESLAYYMFQSPRKAKKLHFDVIPKAYDEYLTFLDKFHTQDEKGKTDNPVWHIHGDNIPTQQAPLRFSLLLNLASACHAEDSAILWGFITRYAPAATPENAPDLSEMVRCALNYYQDRVKPHKSYRAPNDAERTALTALASALREATELDKDSLQTLVFSVGREHGFTELKDWFKALYEILLGQSQGPRFGSFIELYGVEETALLIEKALSGKDMMH